MKSKYLIAALVVLAFLGYQTYLIISINDMTKHHATVTECNCS